MSAPLPSPLPTRVLVRVGDGPGELLQPPRGVVSVGRGEENDVVVGHDLVSRVHVRLRWDGGWVLHDAGSTNGTWLAGERVREVPVSGEVVVRLGGPETGPVLHVGEMSTTRRRSSARVVIGRAATCGLVLDDPMVSREHAALAQLGAETWIEDLGSTNPTLVNDVPVLRHRLSPGDRVVVGGTTLVFDGVELGTTGSSVFAAVDATLALRDGRRIVDGVSFAMHRPSLVAVIGPSGAGKSSLLRLVTGQLPPTSGSVTLDGATMSSQRRAHRGRIGVVPQHTVAHRALTARQALAATAALRLPLDMGPDERRTRVDRQLAELGLAQHADTRVDRLSGGQQRRLSIAMEMVTDPSVLILDEPTAGLDPSLVLQIMQLLRSMAGHGKRVFVVTHDLEHLGLVDTVLVLRAGGTVAYEGPPGGVFDHFGTSSWAETFEALAVPGPVGHRPPAHGAPAPTELRAPRPSASELLRDLRVVALRQVRLTAADPLYAALLLVMPLALAGLALTVPGSDGFGVAGDPTSTEASRLLVLMVVGAAFLGLSATVRDLVGERDIFLHERDAGLSPLAYLAAKVVVLSSVVLLQAALMVGVVLLVRGPPESGLLLGGRLDLVLAAVATALSGVALGLAVSARVRTTEQTMPPLVLLVMAQLVLCGGLFPVDGRGPLGWVSLAVPTRWGYAAAASAVDLEGTSRAVDPDPLWQHDVTGFVLCLLVLVAMWALFLVVSGSALVRRSTRL